jgi:hypothetical protein
LNNHDDTIFHAPQHSVSKKASLQNAFAIGLQYRTLSNLAFKKTDKRHSSSGGTLVCSLLERRKNHPLLSATL